MHHVAPGGGVSTTHHIFSPGMTGYDILSPGTRYQSQMVPWLYHTLEPIMDRYCIYRNLSPSMARHCLLVIGLELIAWLLLLLVRGSVSLIVMAMPPTMLMMAC